MKKLIGALLVGLLLTVACGGDEEGNPTGFFGKSMTKITTIAGQTPEWSPDGDSIVFVYQNDLWMVAPEEGSTPVQLTATTTEREAQPAWHPAAGSRKIIFTKTIDMETYTISTLEVDTGGEPVDIYSARKSFIQPTFTNDGERIAFTSPGVNDGVSLIPASGDGEAEKIANDESWDNLIGAACSPAAPLVAYVRISAGNYNLFTISLEGGAPNQVTGYTNTAGDINKVWFANWSRDGGKLVYSHGTSQYTNIYSIWVVPAAGGTPTQYSEDPEGARSETAQSVNFKHPSFSPDGLRLVAEHHDAIWILEL